MAPAFGGSVSPFQIVCSQARGLNRERAAVPPRAWSSRSLLSPRFSSTHGGTSTRRRRQPAVACNLARASFAPRARIRHMVGEARAQQPSDPLRCPERVIRLPEGIRRPWSCPRRSPHSPLRMAERFNLPTRCDPLGFLMGRRSQTCLGDLSLAELRASRHRKHVRDRAVPGWPRCRAGGASRGARRCPARRPDGALVIANIPSGPGAGGKIGPVAEPVEARPVPPDRVVLRGAAVRMGPAVRRKTTTVTRAR